MTVTVRPRDAAGLVLIRRDRGEAEVLLGRRRRTARFLPGVYVFPGGHLEAADRQPSGFPESFAELPAELDRATRRKGQALLRAAFRETFEETGVLIGRPGAVEAAGPAEVWQGYRAAGLQPAFEAARLLVRAITPTESPIRFHTRFFLIEATGLAHGTPRDEELEEVAWVPVGEAQRLPMVDVTEYVLAQALDARPTPRASLFSYRSGDVRPDLKPLLPARDLTCPAG